TEVPARIFILTGRDRARNDIRCMQCGSMATHAHFERAHAYTVAMKLHWPAPERNKQPILDVLRRVLPRHGTLLEIASGTGQHAAYFARELPGWTWIPSDIAAQQLASIEAYRAEVAVPNLAAARKIDVCSEDWELGPSVEREIDALFSANLIH